MRVRSEGSRIRALIVYNLDRCVGAVGTKVLEKSPKPSPSRVTIRYTSVFIALYWKGIVSLTSRSFSSSYATHFISIATDFPVDRFWGCRPSPVYNEPKSGSYRRDAGWQTGYQLSISIWNQAGSLADQRPRRTQNDPVLPNG